MIVLSHSPSDESLFVQISYSYQGCITVLIILPFMHYTVPSKLSPMSIPVSSPIHIAREFLKCLPTGTLLVHHNYIFIEIFILASVPPVITFGLSTLVQVFKGVAVSRYSLSYLCRLYKIFLYETSFDQTIHVSLYHLAF